MTSKLLTSLALTSVMTLSSCGGSSSDDESVVPPQPTPPEQVHFSFTGFLSQALSVQTPVTITIGDNTYSTTSTDNNSYQLNITYLQSELSDNDWVQVGAQGINQDQHIELINHIGSWGKVKELAGEDGLLDSTESKKLNLTSMSTTHSLLADEIDSLIKTDEALSTAESQIISEELGRYSGFMQLLIDDNQYNVALGETTVSVLQTAETLEDSFYLYQQTTKIDTDDLNKAIGEASKDPLNIDEINQEDLIGLNIFTVDLYQDYVTNFGSSIYLSTDGSAKVSNVNQHINNYEYTQESIGSWQIDNNIITIKVPNETAYSSSKQEYLAEYEIAERWGQEALDKFLELNGHLSTSQVKVLYSPKMIEVIKAGDNSKPIASLIVTQKVELDVIGMGLNWEGELPSVIEAYTVLQSWYLPKQTQSILSKDITGSWALPMPTELDYLDGIEGNLDMFNVNKLVSLNTDNSVIGADNKLGVWHRSDDQIILTLNNGSVISYLPYAIKHGLMSCQITTTINGKIYSTIRWIAKSNTSAISALEDELLSPLPRFLNIGINNYRASEWENNQLKFDSVYGYQGYGNSNFHRISPNHEDYENEENGFFQADDGWAWQRKDEQTLSWSGDFSSRLRYREWQIVSSNGNGHFVVIEFEYRQEDNDNDGRFDEDGFNITPRLNILRVTDLADWPEEHQRSLEKGTLK